VGQSVADSSLRTIYHAELRTSILLFCTDCCFINALGQGPVNKLVLLVNASCVNNWGEIHYKDFEMGKCRSVAARFSPFVGCVTALVFASCAPAFARDQRPAPSIAAPSAPQAPWYERFTAGSELRDGANAWVPRGETKAVVVDSRNRWGVTFGVNQEPRAALAPRTSQSTSRTSAGAFFQVSPKVRVGGAVTLPEEQLGVSPQRRDPSAKREPGVKIESAVRF
jgi:hypothetical protein